MAQTGLDDQVQAAWFEQQALARAAHHPPILPLAVAAVAALVSWMLWWGRPQREPSVPLAAVGAEMQAAPVRARASADPAALLPPRR